MSTYDKCKTKHKRAYKTSFGQVYCPDCEKNIVIVKAVRPAKLPKGAYAKTLDEVLEEYKNDGSSN